VKRFAIEAEPAVEADVEAAFDWYQSEEPGLCRPLKRALKIILTRSRGGVPIESGLTPGYFVSRFQREEPRTATSIDFVL